ncbi:MAG: putative quinol monooxygenase [Candidatus Binatia bacterium]
MNNCRVLEGRVKPGQLETAMQLAQERLEIIRTVSGFLFVQIMHSGDDFIAVSSWRNNKDLQAYAESDLAHDLLNSLTPLCVAPPRVRNFDLRLMVESEEVVLPSDEGGEG